MRVHVDLEGLQLTGPKWDTLPNGTSKTHVFEFDKIPAAPGTYPVLVTIEFADLNLYPFTALNVGGLVIGKSAGPAQLFAKAEPLEMGKKGTLTIAVKNTDQTAKKVRARVLGPRELDVRPAAFEFDLPAGEHVKKELAVENFSALPGAGYPIFVVFDYDQNGVRYSYPVATPVRIAQGGLSASWRNGIIVAGGVLVALVALYEVFRRRKA
ncbi:MAG: hypothetical protein M5R36_27905 [Deltaproteobacteria bacterium]|nr:hypothetical protein [Deltaproteobacteria bacterium]